MMNQLSRKQALQEVDGFNCSYNVGETVLYVKSEVEGAVPLTIIKPAYVLGDNLPVVELESIGLALISKVQPYFDRMNIDTEDSSTITGYEFSKATRRAYLILAALFIFIQALGLVDIGLPEWVRMAVTLPYIFFVGIQLAPDMRIWVRKKSKFSKSNDKGQK
ncbi:hypothetical protein F0267_00225 [Vibrio coralliilyticus]|uniref:Uncharacterized protein n=3 Tax=Vibrio TaxID=662 RepID=A0AAU9QIZ7_9VIBR|nr:MULTISPECIES: hypothetical protein [Vibrio]MCZ2802049.1 hypothetical protein [Vibrio alginolyticus]NOH36644.1 hypothetical protein [Vibrio coralliilyticus]CAH1582341.1 conserved hypothetical protein [Vibrio jasicida]CAH1590836.1 conserved hypothetical protein [Vibrio jasicida]